MCSAGNARDKGNADGRNVAAIAQFGILPDGRVEWGIGTAFPLLSVTREEVAPVPSHPGTFSLRVPFSKKVLMAKVSLLSSDQPGEVVVTAQTIGQTLQRSGMDWHDLAAIVSGEGKR